MTEHTAASLAELYSSQDSPYALFPHEHRSGGSLPTGLIRAEQEAHDFTDPAVPEVLLVVGLHSDMQFRRDFGDGWSQVSKMRSGDMSFVPADTTVDYKCRGSHDILNVTLPSKDLQQLLDENRVGSLASLDSLTTEDLFRDRAIRRTALQMWTESAKTGGTSDLLMDGLTQVLLARLLDKASALRRAQPILLLTQTELSRLDALVDAQLAERITVEDLASALDMPRWTFADAFKAATGETPHSYVTTKRVEKACTFLRLGDMPIAEIAYATGFASQSHMTDTFRRVLDTTPGAWRKEVQK